MLLLFSSFLYLLLLHSLCRWFRLFIVIILKHLGDIFLKQTKQIKQSLVLELMFLLYFDVGFQNLLANEFNQDFYSCVDEALKLVHDHLFLCPHAQILTWFLLVFVGIESLLQVAVIDECSLVRQRIGDYTFATQVISSWAQRDFIIYWILAHDVRKLSRCVIQTLIQVLLVEVCPILRILDQKMINVNFDNILILNKFEHKFDLLLAKLIHYCVVLKAVENCQEHFQRYPCENDIFAAHMKNNL